MRPIHLKQRGRLLLAALIGVLFAIASPAQAGFTNVGPVSGPHGFPLYYTDSNNLSLELCLDEDWCFFDPVDPTDPNQVELGVGGEVFWWMADARMEGGGMDASLTLALEGTFGGDESVVNGQQISFGRLRIRVDVPQDGTYIVTHPYGSMTFNNVTIAEGINYTEDIGAANFLDVENGFLGALQSNIGPYLTWPNYQNNPALQVTTPEGQVIQYVGDNATPHVVVGSPTGNNFFRVVGPGGITAFTDLFTVMGRVYDGKAPLPHTYPPPPPTTLQAVGPINRLTPFNPESTADLITDGTVAGYPLGYPIWYQDYSGLQLTICPGGDPMCISDPIDPNADNGAAQVALQTGGETFWWAGDAFIDEDSAADDPTFVGPFPPVGVDERGRPMALDASLILGLEGTFGGAEALIDGQQISFGRTRIRIDAPFAGTYRVIHPYGEHTFNVPAPGRRAINFTADIGIADPADPDAAFIGGLYGKIGPNFLTWTNYLNEPSLKVATPNGIVQYVGDPEVMHTVTGSVLSDALGNPINYFRVIFTPASGSNAQPFDVRTSQFAIQGKVYDPATFRVGVDQNTAPVVTAPAPITVTAPAGATTVPATNAAIAAFLAGATAVDAQDGPLTVTHNAPTEFPLGTTTVTFSATDSGNLTAMATSTVTVNETGVNNPPVVFAPAPITVTAPVGASAVPASDPVIANFLTRATASDSEDGSLTVTHNAPTQFPLGTTTVTFSATDSGGLTATATSTVTVNAPPAVPLAIQQFKATNQVRLGRNDSVDFTLRVRNPDRALTGITSATIVGVQNGQSVYSVTVPEQIVAGRQNVDFAFPPFTPTALGDITWTVTIFGDTATATTRVRP